MLTKNGNSFLLYLRKKWDREECRRIAKNISENLDKNIIGYGAFSDGTVVGYITVGTSFFGSRGQYVQLVEFEVSEEYRGKKSEKGCLNLAVKRPDQ